MTGHVSSTSQDRLAPPAFSFEVLSRSRQCYARCGRLTTPHGTVDTPVFMPVGTRASVKGLTPRQLTDVSVSMVLANTYHLLLRPGAEVVAELGGLHRFMGWDAPLLTDSGGFQVFSLSSLRRIDDDQVEFASHIDGQPVRLSAAKATQVQNALGADIIMAFDECVSLPCEPQRLRLAVERTLRWARQSRQAHRRSDQWMFAIVQGGTDRALREFCCDELINMDFPGYAIGGLSVGESPEAMIQTVAFTACRLPEARPRYLMGVGSPRDLVRAIEHGIDMFDCVMPTRNGRNACAFVREGTLKLRNEQYKRQDGPLDEQCDCYACRNFSRGYLRHLFLVNEMTGPILVSLHNLAFYQRLMAQARQAIRQDRFADWARPWRDYGRAPHAGDACRDH
ncbi:MAG: tRNA guanosine(34) transglycosylase Tgt [Sedimentisphaerales bacterium]|nr:tRNA guanosine(34) transglycosylase Tgt [Sedimentisphaerales bacterium]